MILFFHGPNNYAARAKLRETIERYLAKNTDIGLEKIYGPEAELDHLVHAITAVPFLAGTRLVIIEELSTNKPAAEGILKHLERVPDTTNVIFFETNPDKRAKFYKTLNKEARVAEFNELEPPKLRAWVIKRAKELGGDIKTMAANHLIERAGTNQRRLEHELAKLVNFEPKITSKTIEELVEPQFADSIFDLVEAIVRGQTKRALELYQSLRAQREEPLYIISMIGWQLHNLLTVKAAGQRAQHQIAKEAGMSPFVVSKSQPAATRVELDTLKQTFEQLLSTDYRLKSSSLDPDIAVEQLIMNVSASLQ